MLANAKFKITATDINGNDIKINPVVMEKGDEVKVVISKEQLDGKKCNTMMVESDLTTVKSGEGGYMFFPTNFTYGVGLCYFDKKENEEFKSEVSAMPVAGICENENAVFIHVQGMDSDSMFYVMCTDGVYKINPGFRLDGDDADEDFVIVYHKMPYATYSDMAQFYRKYQIEVKGCRPIKERIKDHEQLKSAADCIELRIRMGWKPQPTPVRRQTLENEPPMKIACDIKTLNKIIDKMKEKGVEKAEICLVGWGPGGHDGRFPQQYPCDERFGGDDALKAFIKKAQEYGYMVVCHTNSKGAYEIAENWDKSLLTMHIGESGEPEPWLRSDYAKSGLQGGDPWHVCAKPAYEHYAVKDLPVVRDYGYEGLHYVDELTACAPVKCYCKEHPTSRKQVIDYYRKIAKLSTELFGGFQSEAWFDFINADVDYVLYTSVVSEPCEGAPGLLDEIIPFWALVYHGIVMSNSSSKTMNYTIKSEFEHLKLIEFGGRPAMYINSKFCGRDWMGTDDLLCDTDEAIERSVDAIKAAADEYDTLKHLQYEFMENHEKLRDGVYRVTYSDGTIITVDYNKNDYKVINVKNG